MNLSQSTKDWKTLFHVPLLQDDEKLCNKIQPLQSPSNISDMIQNETDSSKLIDHVSTPQGQQLNQSPGLFNIQRPISPSHFFSQHGNSPMSGLQTGEMYNSQNSCSLLGSGIPNLVGYWPVTPLNTGPRPSLHASQHPYLIYQQQSLNLLSNNRFEQSYCSPQLTTQFSSICPSSYLSQRNINPAFFGINRQAQPNDKFPPLHPPISPSFYQLHNHNNSVNYQSYSQLPPLQIDYPSLESISYNSSGEYPNYFPNNQPVFSDGVSGNEDVTSQQYTQVLSQNYHLPPAKQLGSSEYLSTVRSMKTGNSFSNRPFKCDQCFQSFNRNHDLKRHKRIHLAVKPFPCPSCEKSFSRKDALKRHILVKGCIG